MKKSFPWALVMIQPKPLPGSYLNNGESFDEVLNDAINEADMIAKMGFDGFIIQNMHDGPIEQNARTETTAYMTRLGMELRNRYPNLIIGVLINWDGLASLAVAEAINADFVRVEHLYTGVSVTDTGFMFGQCKSILEMKKRLNSTIPIYADVQEVNSMYLVPRPKDVAALDVVNKAYADGIFISGNNKDESLAYIKSIRKTLVDTPIFLGGGATGDNVCELMKYYDGVSVATWIKNGNMRNPIDPQRASYFLSEIEKARKYRNNL